MLQPTNKRMPFLILLLTCSPFFGCMSVPRETAEALDETWQLIAPYAAAGIEAADIDDRSKQIRLRTVQAHGDLIQEMLRKYDTE